MLPPLNEKTGVSVEKNKKKGRRKQQPNNETYIAKEPLVMNDFTAALELRIIMNSVSSAPA
jgi:hypothetical protein